MKKPYLLFFVAAFFAYGLNLWLPFVHGDEAAWMTLGQQAFSGTLYETITDNKPPFLIQLYGLFTSEGSMLPLRIFLIFLTVAGAFAFRKILKLWVSESSATKGALLYIIASGLIENGAVTCERLYLPLIFISYALVRDKKLASLWQTSALVGFLLGLAANIKQPAALLGFWIGLEILWLQRSLLHGIFTLFGFLVAFLVTWTAVGTPWSIIYEEIFKQNLQYMGADTALPWKDIIQNALYALLCYFPLIVGAILSIKSLFISRMTSVIPNVSEESPDQYLRKNVERRFLTNVRNDSSPVWGVRLLTLILLTTITFCLGKRFYQTYYIAWLPLLIAGTTLAIEKSSKKIWISTLTALIMISTGFQVFIVVREMRDQNKTWNTRVHRLVASIQKDSQPSDTIWVSNAVHSGYATTLRKPATKHFCFQQVLYQVDICQTSESRLQEDLANKNYQRLLRDLSVNQPKVVFWAQSPSNACAVRLKLEKFPTLKQWIEKNYTLIYSDELGIYYRKNGV